MTKLKLLITDNINYFTFKYLFYLYVIFYRFLLIFVFINFFILLIFKTNSINLVPDMETRSVPQQVWPNGRKFPTLHEWLTARFPDNLLDF